MEFINKLERKFGKYAIPHLTRYIILTYVIGYIFYFLDAYAGTNILYWISLNPQLIMQGQVWRIFSWLVTPPTQLSIFSVIMLFCYYQLGSVLERAWGNFRYNVYIIIGLLTTFAGAFIINLTPLGNIYFVLNYPIVSTYYVALSIFLGFAITFPEQQMLFMFLIPIKIKWLAIVDVVYLAWQSISQLVKGNYITLLLIICSLAGTIIYFILTRDFRRQYRNRQRQKQFYQSMNRGYGPGRSGAGRGQGTGGGAAGRYASYGGAGGAIHKCTVCGQTEKDDPTLEFRFCSRCSGNHEYCNKHLFTHTHIK